jgi:hypothetical protein
MNGKPNTKLCAARPCDAGRTGLDPAENGPAPYIDGYIVHMDTSDIRAQTAELQKIGVNVNQIARRINSTGTVYAQDIEDIKGALAKIWQLQRYILSSQR